MGERFLFIPSFAFCIAVVYFAGKIFSINFSARKIKSKPALTFVALIILALFSYRSYSRSKIWKDDYTLIMNDFEYSNSYRTRISYVEELYRIISSEKNTTTVYRKLTDELSKLMKDYPEDAEVWYLNGIVNASMGKNEIAVSSYKKSLEFDNKKLDALNNLGAIYHRNRQLESALKYYNRILAIDSTYSRVYGNIGMIYHFKGKLSEAEKYYKVALKFEPSNATIRKNYDEIIKSRSNKH
jgi:tetratricopeptide (TPR) repeat protein